MGSKHRPPKWWKDYDSEIAHAGNWWLTEQERQFAAIADSVPHDRFYIEPKDPKPGSAADTLPWTTQIEDGALCYTEDGREIGPAMVTYPGMKIIVPTLVGYTYAVIHEDGNAYSEGSMWFLRRDPRRGLVCWGGGNLAAISKIDLQ